MVGTEKVLATEDAKTKLTEGDQSCVERPEMA